MRTSPRSIVLAGDSDRRLTVTLLARVRDIKPRLLLPAASQQKNPIAKLGNPGSSFQTVQLLTFEKAVISYFRRQCREHHLPHRPVEEHHEMVLETTLVDLVQRFCSNP